MVYRQRWRLSIIIIMNNHQTSKPLKPLNEGRCRKPNFYLWLMWMPRNYFYSFQMQRFCTDIAKVLSFLSSFPGSFEARIQWGRSPTERLQQTTRTRRTVSCWAVRRRPRRKTAFDSNYPPRSPSNTMGTMEDMRGWELRIEEQYLYFHLRAIVSVIC